MLVLGCAACGCGGRATDHREWEGAAPQREPAAAAEAEQGQQVSDVDALTLDPDSAPLEADTPTPDPDSAPSETDALTLDPDSAPAEPPVPPSGCEPSQWRCEVDSCGSDDAPVCEDDWYGRAVNCPMVPKGCTCSTEPPLDIPDCGGSDHILTCLVGLFRTGEDYVETFRHDCKCLPFANTCTEVCEAHHPFGSSRACTQSKGLVVCGGCLQAGSAR